MAFREDQVRQLLKEADLLQPPANFRSPLEIADRLGIEVWLKGGGQNAKRDGFLDYGKPPKIQIMRGSEADFTSRITPENENVLSARERFTLAHELGHWIAHDRLGVGPASARSEYWRDENIVNQFASRLLIPNWRLETWLSNYDVRQGVHIQQIMILAQDLRLSGEVVSRRVCEQFKGAGVLKLRTRRRAGAHFPDLFVEHSAADPSLRLPRRPALIRNERLYDLFAGATANETIISNLSFDPKRQHYQDYFVSWVRYETGDRRGPINQDRPLVGVIYWTSWSNSSFAYDREPYAIRKLV